MRHLIIGQVGVKIITSVTGGGGEGGGIKHVVENMPQSRWKCQSCKQNKLDKLSNFAVNGNHAIEEQSQSRSCFESKDGERISFV